MKLNITYIIIIIIILVLCLIVYDKRNLKLFDHFYEDMTVKAYLKYNKIFKTPLYTYSTLSGYENGNHVKELITNLEKKNVTYVVAENQYNKLQNKSAKDSIVNSFILGDTYNYNKDNKQIAKIHYTNTLNRINTYPNAIINDNNMNIIEPNPEHMIDRIEDFYLDNNIDNNKNIETARINLRNARLLNISNKKNNILFDTTDTDNKEYFKPKIIKSDPQNVHDTSVNAQIKNKYNIIKQINSQSSSEYTIDDIKNNINLDIDNNNITNKINKVIENMTGFNTNLDDTEQDILLNVWKRVNTGTNIACKKKSFYKSMENCIEKTLSGKELVVCSSGKCGRIIDSLTCIDGNKELSEGLKSSDIIRNEALSKSYNLLQSELVNENPDIQKIYNTGKGDLKKIEKFEIDVKDKITKTIKLDYKHLPDRLVNNIIDDCIAGI